MESRIPHPCHRNGEETTKKSSTPIQAHSIAPARSFAPVARTLLKDDNCDHGPYHRQALSASIEESILCSAVDGLGLSGGANYCAIIKPINVIPEYLAKMLLRA
jgi:hypothetical protein